MAAARSNVVFEDAERRLPEIARSWMIRPSFFMSLTWLLTLLGPLYTHEHNQTIRYLFIALTEVSSLRLLSTR
jgi:hypothetical protein